ncbi:trs120p [Saccharomyces arboricola H-6]|uniref:Trs120p n=1 Tax=Saccharomyces arboricola (strain H-6 / AS 2.3317 / CBS 10644) TaxID=1160507 RepID=J8PJC8_SACAR|nr:trs120p [Saccharomyces arboricola H-6]
MNILKHFPSYVGPSKIRTLVIPIGHWKRKEFNDAVQKLSRFNEIHLSDVTPIDSPIFTPQGFPHGRLFFEFLTIDHDDALELFLYDFEPFRKTFVIIGLVNDSSDPLTNLNFMKEKYPTLISPNLVYTSDSTAKELKKTIDSIVNVFVSSPDIQKNIETIMCDIARNFLIALNNYYSSYKHVTLRSPGAIGGNSVLKTTLIRQSRYTSSSSTTSMSAVQSLSTSSSSKANSAANASKRLSSFEMTTSSLKRSASLKIATTLSTSENRVQQKSLGRQLKILGNFQLLAGRYVDALNSFTDAITTLYKVRDYLWLGSALDGISISFLLLSYLDLTYQIPQIVNLICPVEKLNAETSSVSVSPVDSNSKTTAVSTTTASTPRNSISIAAMQSPRNSMISLSSPALNIDVENINLPLLVKCISDKILYYYDLSLMHNSEYAPQVVYCECLLKTLTFMTSCYRSSEFSKSVLDSIVKNQNKALFEIPNNPIFPRCEIYFYTNKLFELQLKEMQVEAQVNIYSTMAEVYRLLGYERKQLFVLRLLMVALLATSNKIAWHPDYRSLIDTIVELFDINERQPESNINDASQFSWLILQKKILQLCIKVSRRISDFAYVAKFSSILVTRYTHLLSQSEQDILFREYIQPSINNLSIASYWDPFLLREIVINRILDNDPISNEIPLESDINSVENLKDKQKSQDIDPQEVFNPFKQLQATSFISNNNEKSSILVFLVGDKAEFTCRVQNPFKFDITIDDIQLDEEISKFCEIDKKAISYSGPYDVKAESIRSITLPLIIKKPTFKKIYEVRSLKISVLQLPFQQFDIVEGSRKSSSVEDGIENDRCIYGKLRIKILPEQPQLELLNTSKMTRNSWMMLDGTKTDFHITVRNKSLSCAINYIRIIPINNVEQMLKPDYWKKMPPDDLYIMEKQLDWLSKSCIRIIKTPKIIKPNETITFDLELDNTAVPFNFTGFDLLIEYGMNAADKSCIYLKKLTIPYEVTLRRTIEVPSMDIIPLNELFSSQVENLDWIEYVMNQIRINTNLHPRDFILLLVDFRNSWIDGIKLNVQFEDFISNEYHVEANHTSRIIVPVRKIDYKKYNFENMPIPRIYTGRQFIQSGLSEEQIIEMRQKFWCREHIVSGLKCNWRLTTDRSVTGSLDFNKFIEKFDHKMVSTIYTGRLFFEVQLLIDKPKVKVGERASLRILTEPTNTCRRKQTSTINFLDIIIFDKKTSKLLPRSNRRILYNGSLTKPISTANASEVDLEIIPIERGHYEFGVCISKSNNQDGIVQFDSESVILSVI